MEGLPRLLAETPPERLALVVAAFFIFALTVAVRALWKKNRDHQEWQRRLLERLIRYRFQHIYPGGTDGTED